MMNTTLHPQPFCAVVVAAGKGTRAGQSVPKQFALWRGKPVVRHAVEALVAAGAGKIAVAIPADCNELAMEALAGLDRVSLVAGGETRQRSVHLALETLDGVAEAVLIHDAARPDLPPAVVERLLAALHYHPGAIPVLPVVDSLAIDDAGMMSGSAQRESLRRVQTPQAFRFTDILAAYRDWSGEASAGDDAQVLRAAGQSVALVEGDERLKKLTYAEDFMSKILAFRMGSGYDVHRLVKGEELWLGGVRIEHEYGLSGHSDADVALHALTDAVLGAIADGDIGSHFPPSDPQWRGASSDRFLVHAAVLAQTAGYSIGNVDLTIICEAPKIGPHRDAMRARIAELLGVDIGQVSVKATTTERLGYTGRGEGIAAQAIATLIRE